MREIGRDGRQTQTAPKGGLVKMAPCNGCSQRKVTAFFRPCVFGSVYFFAHIARVFGGVWLLCYAVPTLSVLSVPPPSIWGVLAHQFPVQKAICHKLQKALFPACRGCFLAFFGQFWVFLRACWNQLGFSAHHLETIFGGTALPDSYINRCCIKHVIAFHFPK